MGLISPLLSYNTAIVAWEAGEVDEAPLLRRNNPPSTGRCEGLLAAIFRRAQYQFGPQELLQRNGGQCIPRNGASLRPSSNG
jgi:hypothetical protein